MTESGCHQVIAGFGEPQRARTGQASNLRNRP
jgi:hypothetical protein